MRRALGLLWRWSPLVTAPIAALFLWWAFTLARDYRDFQLRYDLAPHRYSLNLYGRERMSHIRHSLGAMMHGVGEVDLREIHLAIADEELAALESELPHSGFDYVPARLWNGDEFQEVEVRYRGDFMIHWANDKKSLRIKTKKSERLEGIRRFNLIAPKFPAQIHTCFGYRLANLLGVLAPHSEMVLVHLNDSFQGLFVLVEQIEKPTLRRNRRMPGDVYAGELVANESWRGITNFLFDHPGLWEKATTGDDFPAESRQPIERLCEIANSWTNEATHRELAELLDLEAWGRFSALETLIQYFHTGPMHNWRLYHDPWRNRIEPILWDPNAWGHFEKLGPEPPISLDPNATRLHSLLFTNARFLLARQAALREFFEDGKDRQFLAEMEAMAEQVRSIVPADPNCMPPDTDAVLESLDGLLANVRRVFAHVKTAFVEGDDEVLWSRTPDGIDVQITGRRPVTRLRLELDRDVPVNLRARLQLSRSSGTSEVDISGALRCEGRSIELDLPLHSQLRTAPRVFEGLIKVFSHRVEPGHYGIAFDGLTQDAALREVHCERGDGVWQPCEQRPNLAPAVMDQLFGVTAGTPAETTWSGEIRIDDIQTIDGNLVIEAGTTVQLGPGAAVICRGRLSARGTTENPIVFRPRDPQAAPWGTLAIVGPRSAGSELRHCELDGGGGITDSERLLLFPAMLSIHDCPGIVLEHCQLSNSRVADDMVHAVYSSVGFEHCVFAQALSDAVDLDYSDGRFHDCRFLACGNDAIDLTASRIAVHRTVFADSADKGITAGEDSQVAAVDVVFTGCRTAVLANDGAVVAIHGGEFSGNGKALDASGSHWRTGRGGAVHAFRSIFRDNRDPPGGDDGSTVRIELPEPGDRVVLPPGFEDTTPEIQAVWKDSDPTRRGAGLQ